MKKKFYPVGLYIYNRDKKCGAEVLALTAIAAVGTAVGSVASANSNESINEANLQQAKENNQLSLEMMRENNQFNATEAEKARQFNANEAEKASQFNAEQAQINREFAASQFERALSYNSIGEQVTRARNAGINPAAILGGGSTPVTSFPQGSAASTGAASGPAASASGIPSLSSANLQSNAVMWQNLMKGISETAGNLIKNNGESKKNEYQDHLNMWIDREKEAGINVSKSQNRLLNSQAELNMETREKILKEMDVLDQQINMMDAQEAGIRIDNFFKSDIYRAQLAEAAANTGKSKAEIDYMVKKFLIERAEANSRIKLNIKLGNLYDEQKKLTSKEVEKADKEISILTTQDDNTAWNNMLDHNFGVQEREMGLQIGNQTYKDIHYRNSGLGRTLDSMQSILGSASAFMGMYAGAKMVSKGKVKTNPNYDKTGSYFINVSE